MKYWTVFRNSKAGLLGKIGNILEIMKNVGVETIKMINGDIHLNI